MRKKASIVLIGPLPPPAGGVSIHIQRLWHLLRDAYDFDFIDESKNVKKGIFNLRSLNLPAYINKLLRADLVWIHSGTDLLKYFHIVVGKLARRKVIFTLHAYPAEKKGFRKKLDEWIYGLCDMIIPVNAELPGRLSLPDGRVQVMYAFLPPALEAEEPLPQNIRDWIDRTRAEGKKILCANAWRLDRFNNQDLYGVDLCIEASKRLKEAGYSFRFLFNLATIDMYADDYRNYLNLIRSLDLEDHFFLMNEPMSFVRMMQESDLVFRPTNTDGDSLTIREALFLEKPIIASDVVDRPPGTILFRNRDIDDLEEKIRDLWTGRLQPLATG